MKVTYRGLNITLPYEIIEIEHFKLVEKLNEHVHIKLTASVEEGKVNELLKTSTEKAVIQVSRQQEQSSQEEILFKGHLSDVTISNRGEVTLLQIEAVSMTYEWDLEKKSRTFQDLSLTYGQVIDKVLADYGQADWKDMITENTLIGDLLLQFEETDWTFIKRLASHFGAYLLPEASASYGRVFFGIPRIDNQISLKSNEFNVVRQIDEYHHESIIWKVKSHKCLHLGEQVNWQNVKCQVIEATYTTDRSELVYLYTLQRQESMGARYMTNERISGMSIPGIIKERKGNCLRVHFNIDETYTASSTNKFFTFAIETSSWYCMPVEGSKIHIYFQNKYESSAIAIHALRIAGESEKYYGKISNPDNKSFSSVEGMELEMTPSTITFAPDDQRNTNLVLNKDGSISLLGSEISIHAPEKVSIGNLEISNADIQTNIIPKELIINALNFILIAMVQGNTIDDNKVILVEKLAFIKAEKVSYYASVKNPPAIVYDDSELKKQDAAARQASNDKVLADKLAATKSNFNIGLGLCILGTVCAAVALTVLTGGVGAPAAIMAATAAIGGMTTAICGRARMSEASMDYNKMSSGDFSQSYNAVRDGLMGGNQQLYDTVMYMSASITAMLTLALVFPCPNIIFQGFTSASITTSMGALQDVSDGFIDGSVGDYLKMFTEDCLFTIFTAGLFKILKDSSKIGALLNQTGRYAGVVQYLGETALDLGATGIYDKLCGRETDWPTVLISTAISNALFSIDPVNVATGSFYIPAVDLTFKDVSVGEWQLQRTYNSVFNYTGMLGRRWVFAYESHLKIKEDTIDMLCMDGHAESFYRVDEDWLNNKGGSSTYTLKWHAHNRTWTVYYALEKLIYVFNEIGQFIEVWDKNDNKTTLTYNGEAIDTITTFSGHKLYLTYANGRIVEIKDELNRTIQYKYENDCLTHVCHVDEGISTYKYDENAYILQATDQNNHAYITNSYDRKGRLVSQTYPNGMLSTMHYDDALRETTVYIAESNKTEKYRYNKDYLVTQIIYEDGTTIEYGYDQWHNKVYEKDRMGAITKRTYTVQGSVLREELPSGLTTEYSYDASNILIKQANNIGEETLYLYDDQSNLIEERTKINEVKWKIEQYDRDHYGRIVQVKDALGNITKYEYNHSKFILPEPTRVVDAAQNSYEYVYDEVGRNTLITTAYGTVEIGYNRLNKISYFKDGNGQITRRYYDQLGNLITFLPPASKEQESGLEKGYHFKYDFFDQLIEIKDPLGHVRRLERDLEGNVIREINPNTYLEATKEGIGTRYFYNKDNKRICIEYADGGTARSFYDANGNLIKYVSPVYYDQEKDDGLGYAYLYNESNQLTAIINEEGKTIKKFIYDLKGRMIEQIDAKGHRTLLGYDLVGNLVEKREPIKREGAQVYYRLTLYEYDLSGNKTKEKQGKDFVTEETYAHTYFEIMFSYDPKNRLVGVKDRYGAQVVYDYDVLNNKIYESQKINDHTYKVTRYVYDAVGQLIEQKVDIEGKFISKENRNKKSVAITKYQYDANANCIQVITPKGYEIHKVYNAVNQVSEEYHQDKENGIYRRYAYKYDKANNVIERIDTTFEQQPKTRKYIYDLKNRLTHFINENGHTTKVLYDSNDRIIKQVLPEQYDEALNDGPGMLYSYNMQGQVTQITNALGEIVTQNTYDSLGNLIALQEGNTSKVEYTYNLLGQIKDIVMANEKTPVKVQGYYYDARGNITGIIDGNSQMTQYRLDDWGRMIELIAPDGGREHYTYDYAGNITSTTDANGNSITYTYNNLGKVCEIQDQEGLTEQFYYDLEGNTTCYIDRNGNQVRTQHNMDGNLVFKQAYDTHQDHIVTERFSYNLDGTLSMAKAGGRAYQYQYTPEGFLESKSTSGRNLLKYSYDKNGNLKSLWDVSGKTNHYTYDAANRVQVIKDGCENALATYTYYANNQIQSVTCGNGIATNYSYDAQQNKKDLVITGSNGEVLINYHYAYDGNGNRTEKIGDRHQVHYQYDCMNRLIEAQYDKRKESFTYDLVGNRLSHMVNGTLETYTYNAKNQLQQITSERGLTYFTYDKQGNTIKEETPKGSNLFQYNTLNQQVSATTFEGNTLKSKYDAEGLRYEIEENERLTHFIFHKKNILVEADKEDKPLIRFTRGQEVVAADYIQGSHALTTYYYSQDEQGSTLYLTDKNQEIQNEYFYDAFGNTIESQENLPNRITYVGQQYDSLTQQYYLRARYYNPIIGRFTQEDTYRGDGLNLYAYCKNNAVVYFDPSGFIRLNCDIKNNAFNEGAGNTGIDGKMLSKMTDQELADLGYKRYSDGSIRDSKGHFAGNSGTIPGTPGVDIAEKYLMDNGFIVNGREISVRTADGTLRRYDIVVTASDGTVIGVEVKSGSATRTVQQISVDNELIDSGGLNTVGKKAVDANIQMITDVKIAYVNKNGNIIIK